MLLYIIEYLSYPFVLYLIFCLIRLKRQRCWAWFIILLILTGLFIYARFIEPQIIKVRNYDVNIPGSKNFKIAVISDTHLGPYSGHNFWEWIISLTTAAHPDLVLLPGDWTDYLAADKYVWFKDLDKIGAPAFGVLGNHDWGMPVGPDNSAGLKQALGAYLIDNSARTLTINGQKIKVVGLMDYYTSQASFDLLRKDDATSTAALATSSEVLIALTHNPDITYDFPTSSQADLIIAGHTHGGQVLLPWIYKLFIPTKHNFVRGFYQVLGRQVFVSSGLGMAGLPLRFLVPPEIDILNIK